MAVIASRQATVPETDLGVVASTPATEEISNQAAPDLPMELKSADPSDLPSVENVIAQPEAGANAGDVPVIEPDLESEPVTDGSKEDASGKDGN